MATEVPFALHAAVGVQTARGQINATIRDLAGAIGPADGLVIGDPASGIGESGVALRITRDLEENVRLGNLTSQPSQFVATLIENLSLAWRLQGNGVALATALNVDEWKPVPAVDATLSALGLAHDATVTDRYRYIPGTPTYLTIALWLMETTEATARAIKYVAQDCLASGQVAWQGGEIGVATASLTAGAVPDAFNGVAVDAPTFSSGSQASGAPKVSNAGFAWPDAAGGAGLDVRACTTHRLDFSNTIRESPDFNAAGGKRLSLESRDIDAQLTVYASQENLAFEADELKRTTAPVDGWSFTVGDVAALVGEVPLGYRVLMTTPEVRGLTPVRDGDLAAWDAQLRAVAQVANAGFALEFI